MYQASEGLASAKPPFLNSADPKTGAPRPSAGARGEPGKLPTTDRAKTRDSDAKWQAMDHRARLARHADLSIQILAHQIQSDYTLFYKRHVKPAVVRRVGPDAPRLNLREHSLILALSQIPEGQSGVDLAFLIRSDPATVSRNINLMTKKGLVVARTDPHDSRAYIYTLTEAGWDLSEAYRLQWRDSIARADSVIGPLGEMEFRDQLFTFYSLKDRARAHAEWHPGDRNAFQRGMGRPEPSVRPDIKAVRVDVDSFFRYFGQQISSDYLSCIGTHLARPLLRELRKDGTALTLTDLRTLMCLDFHDEALSGADVARRMRFDPATVTRATTALEEGGLVSMRTSTLDRRRLEIDLTAEGHALAARYRRRADEMESRIERDFDLNWSEYARRKAITHILAARHRARRLAKLRRLPN